MEFSKEFLKNKFFRNQALGFNPPLDEKIGETRFKSGAILQPNGDYLFKIIYVFLTIFLYLLKCPQSLIL